jgi:transposase
MRRCQVILASARGEQAPRIATSLGCHEQTVRNVIHAFNATEVRCLEKGSKRPHTSRAAFDEEGLEKLRGIVHRSPREFDKPTSLWTLALVAEVSFEEGLTERRVSGETIRTSLKRLGIKWRRAKEWITSPDPQYEVKRGLVTG